MEYVWNMHGICEGCVRICMAYVIHMHGTYTRSMCGVFVAYVCNMYRKCLEFMHAFELLRTSVHEQTCRNPCPRGGSKSQADAASILLEIRCYAEESAIKCHPNFKLKPAVGRMR